ncbi:ribosomal RNA-processing protein 1 [Terramyces sp. JEL0728]|nr:ribosomal RNA-processing protein 1 [Terramyces sp. JEL0728]
MNAKIEKLYAWMEENGIKSKIQVKESYGLGLFTKASKGQVVLSVPKSLVIHRTNSLDHFEKSPIGFEHLPFMKAPNDAGTQRICILMYLTHLIYNPTPYSDLLPKEIKSPVGWDTESVEYKLLHRTGLDYAVQSKHIVIEHEYDLLDLKMGLEVYKLVDHLYCSRVMSMVETEQEKEKTADWVGIVPILDFCNHSFTPNANWEIKNDTIDLILLENVDGEIFINYGPKPNNELLFLHDDNDIKLSTFPPLFEDEEENEKETVSIFNKQRIILSHQWGGRIEIGRCDPELAQEIDENVPIDIRVLLNGILDVKSMQILNLCVLRKSDGFYTREGKYFYKEKETDLYIVPYTRSKVIPRLIEVLAYHLESLDDELEDGIELSPTAKIVLDFRQQLCEMLKINFVILHDILEEIEGSDVENKERLARLMATKRKADQDPISTTFPTTFNFAPEPNLKLVSWNIASLNSSIKKGFYQYIKAESPDILCIQETKLNSDFKYDLPSYKIFQTHSTAKKGYSGVCMMSKTEPQSVKYGIGDLDDEGRYITLEYEKFFVVGAYIPNAGQKLERLERKTKHYQVLKQYLSDLPKPVVFMGDLNVAHKEVDLTRPKNNHKTAGFTKEEREEFQKLLDLGFVDTYRLKRPNETDR